MGCRESKQEDAADTDPMWNGAKFRDPVDSERIAEVEAEAHIAAWKDARTRQRIENTLRNQGSSALRAAVSDGFPSLHIREEDDIDIENSSPIRSNLASQSHARSSTSHHSMNDHGSSAPATAGEVQSAPSEAEKKSSIYELVQEPEAHPVLPATPDLTVDNEKLSSLHEKKRRIEQEQERARKQQMLTVDPTCWKALAAEQRYQYADDLLSEAQKVEEEVNGRTERLASLSLALAALFDERSNLDQTGQQQALSWAAVVHARKGLAVLASLGWAPLEAIEKAADSAAEDEEQRRADVLSGGLLIGGRNLCHFALDGDGEGCTAVEAMGAAEEMLKQAIALRKRFKHAGLGETVMMLGYLHYCRAGSLSNAFQCSTRSVLSTTGDVEQEYRAALRTYHEALQLFAANGHPDGRDTIRPMCNIALAYKTLSMLDPSALQHAKSWYERALSLQESLFGKSDLSRRINADLDDVRKQLKGPQSPGGSWSP